MGFAVGACLGLGLFALMLALVILFTPPTPPPGGW